MKKVLNTAIATMAFLGVAIAGALADDDDHDRRGNKLTVYMAKFVCGDGGLSQIGNGGVFNAYYRTAINIGNPNDKTIEILKAIVPTEALNTEFDTNGQEVNGPIEPVLSDELPPFHAVEWDCGQIPFFTSPTVGKLVKGFLVIKVDGKYTRRALNAVVTSVYTVREKTNNTVTSIDVEQIPGQEAEGELEINFIDAQ